MVTKNTDNAPLERLNVMIRAEAKKRITNYQAKNNLKNLDSAAEQYILASNER